MVKNEVNSQIDSQSQGLGNRSGDLLYKVSQYFVICYHFIAKVKKKRLRSKAQPLCLSLEDLLSGIGVDDVQQFNFENQHSAWFDNTAAALVTVGQVGGDPEFILGTNAHQLDTFGPTFDDLVQGELSGAATFNRAVKYFAVHQCTMVVYANNGSVGR